MWRVVFLTFTALLGFWFGKSNEPEKKPQVLSAIQPEKEFPLSDYKSFVIVLYAHNQELWCERALQSVFKQDYDHYRVVVIDDGSVDSTFEKTKEFILENNQDEKVILIRNEKTLGLPACMYRAVDSCLDREIVIPLDAKDWLSSDLALKRLNLAYQNPDVWLSFASMLEYPSYEIAAETQSSFYAALFKQIQLKSLFKNGRFPTHAKAYLNPLVDLSGGRIREIKEPIAFSNGSPAPKKLVEPSNIPEYAALKAFPESLSPKKADILVFSFDRPLQLYACLESIQRYFSGFTNLSVLYRASSAAFLEGYEKVKSAFPLVHFVLQSTKDPKHDFKPKVNQIVFGAPSEYILFAVDDIIVKDFVDLSFCMEEMEKTGAYGFYLRMGRHISHCYQFDKEQKLPPSEPLASGVFAWDFKTGELDWGFPNSLDMTLFRKEDLKKPFKELKFKTPNSLESNWAAKYTPTDAVGLYFESSKMVNIPMNIVGRTGNPHMNYLDVDELLVKFNQGLKIDIDPLYKIENTSPHLDYIPEFTLR